MSALQYYCVSVYVDWSVWIASCRVCVKERNYVDKDTGLCQACPPATQPVLIFLGYLCAIGLALLLLYVLIRRSWHWFRRSAQATRWIAAVHARSFGRQGPSKFRV